MSRIIPLITLILLALAGTVTANEREDDVAAEAPATDSGDAPEQDEASSSEVEEEDGADTVKPLELLGKTVQPGTFETLHWAPDQSFRSIATPVPVLVAHGNEPGPRLCLTAAVHGDELNGIEMVRRLMYELEPTELAGTVVGVPIVNLDGFRNGSRYLSDRRDLNRYFPGHEKGSAASRLAFSLFNNIVRQCDYLVDLHTGSQKRINQPQLRADLDKSEVVAFAKHFGGMTVLHSPPGDGMLRAAAVEEGIVAVTMEAGGPNRLEGEAVDYGVQALETLLETLDMRKASRFWGAPQPVFFESEWIRAGQGGILLSEVELNDQVRKGEILGTVTDPISNTGSAIIAPYDGRVLGMAVNQVVHAGFAAEEVEAKAELSDQTLEDNGVKPEEPAAPKEEEEAADAPREEEDPAPPADDTE